MIYDAFERCHFRIRIRHISSIHSNEKTMTFDEIKKNAIVFRYTDGVYEKDLPTGIISFRTMM